jgi:membrane-associated phospholipid phosphatase
MNWKRDGALIVIGIPLAALGIAMDRLIDPLTLEEVNNLDRNQIFKPDRFVSYNYSERASKLSDILLYTCMTSPLLLLSSKSIRNDIVVISGMYLESLIFGVALPAYGKSGIQRIRPYTYNPELPLNKKLTAEAKRSFFSGHTTMAFTSMVFLSTIYSTYYPESKAKPYIWTGSLLLASTVGYLRMAAGSHFLTDVLVGAIVGTTIGYIIPKIHETDKPDPALLMPEDSPRAPLISFRFAL